MSKEKIVIAVDRDLEEIMPTFLDNRRSDLLKLDQAMKSGDYKSIEMIAHKLAGNAGSYGLPDLGKIGSELEIAAAQEKSEKIEELIKAYRDYMERLDIKFA